MSANGFSTNRSRTWPVRPPADEDVGRCNSMSTAQAPERLLGPSADLHGLHLAASRYPSYYSSSLAFPPVGRLHLLPPRHPLSSQLAPPLSAPILSPEQPKNPPLFSPRLLRPTVSCSQSSSRMPQSSSQFPQHFMRGSIIQLANGTLKCVEELRTDDFFNSASLSPDLQVDSSTVVRIDELDRGAAVLGFSVGQKRIQVTVEAHLEHPFFVIGEGWSSVQPARSRIRYGLNCKPLKVGDVCISLTHKDASRAINQTSQQQTSQQQTSHQQTSHQQTSQSPSHTPQSPSQPNSMQSSQPASLQTPMQSSLMTSHQTVDHRAGRANASTSSSAAAAAAAAAAMKRSWPTESSSDSENEATRAKQPTTS